MKKSVMTGIIIILVLLVAVIFLSPFSPINKVSVNGEGIKLPTGYSVLNTTKNELKITNGTNNLSIYPTDTSTDLNEATTTYKHAFLSKYNITVKKLSTNNSIEVYKTVAKNENETITKYWFNHKDMTYNIRTKNAVPETDNVAKTLISSMN